jgi:POT family proton-dependent oligopeptide transporter
MVQRGLPRHGIGLYANLLIVTPIFGAIIADQYLGKYWTIVCFGCVYMVGLLILFLTALPVSLQNGAGLGGFIAAILIIGLGTGGIKSNVSPLIADQYTRKKMAIKTLKSGERVIIDPAVTIQRIYIVFYCCINVGALSLLATPYMERDIGFWSAYLLCFCMFIVGMVCVVLGRKYYIVRPPTGSIITNAFRAIGIMIKNRNMDAPKPSYQEEFGRSAGPLPWDDLFIDELKRALVACRVFVFYPVYWLVYSQFSGNFVSQAEQMRGHGIPNDLMQNFDPIAILFFAPILDRLVYPMFQKYHIKFRPIARITFGFFIASMSMLYAAILQHYIYKAGPCYGRPLCDLSVDASGTNIGNNIHIAIQTPAYMLIGISEIFASVTGLEYAYMKAPPSMKSFVQAMYLLTNAFGYAIGEAFTPLVGDPQVLWLFTGLCAGSFGVGCLFWFLFHHLDRKEDEMNMLDGKHADLENKQALTATGHDGNVDTGEARRVNKTG